MPTDKSNKPTGSDEQSQRKDEVLKRMLNTLPKWRIPKGDNGEAEASPQRRQPK